MTIIIIDNKILCSKCNTVKDLSDFPRDKNRKIGFTTSRCNSCKARMNRELYSIKPEIWEKSIKKWEDKSGSKKAYRAIRRAVMIGKIIKPERCMECGKKAKLDAHHHKGYEEENMLDVVWLCRPCHKKRKD